ncbi:MAG: SHOCT domain-containing protein [Opitutaceae bacterium]|jgi:hypothetical protein
MNDEDSFRFNSPRRGFSVKPGRGPSAFGALAGVGAVIFGIFWTIMAFSITRNSPFPMVGTIFPLFGVVFVLVGVGRVVYDLRNATGRDRNSIVDVLPQEQEPDPLDARFGRSSAGPRAQASRTTDVEARLSALQALRSKGSITEVEYAEQRSRILSEL